MQPTKEGRRAAFLRGASRVQSVNGVGDDPFATCARGGRVSLAPVGHFAKGAGDMGLGPPETTRVAGTSAPENNVNLMNPHDFVSR